MDPIVKERIPILNDQNQFQNLKATILHQSPAIARIEGLLTPDECQYIIDLAKPQLSPSTMIVGNREVVNPARSSKSAYLTRSGEIPTQDPVIHRFLSRCSILSGIPMTHFEGMKVVNYQKGQEYKAHHDYFRHHTNFTRECGDRLLTFFVYLNTLEAEDGGGTYFPKLDIRSRPVAGDAMFWTNLDFNGNYYEETLHAGEPVIGETEKWGINVWVRQEPYC